MVKTCLMALALAVLAYGCGSGGGSSSTATEAALRICSAPTRPSGEGITAAGWSGKVSGISCADAGRLIEHHALRDLQKAYRGRYRLTAIRSSAPGDFSSAGFACHYVPLSSGQGWHVTCQQAQQTVDFLVTP